MSSVEDIRSVAAISHLNLLLGNRVGRAQALTSNHSLLLTLRVNKTSHLPAAMINPALCRSSETESALFSQVTMHFMPPLLISFFSFFRERWAESRNVPENVKRGVDEEEEEEEKKWGSDRDHFLPAKQDVDDKEWRLCGFSQECACRLYADHVRFAAPVLTFAIVWNLRHGQMEEKQVKNKFAKTSHSFFAFFPLMWKCHPVLQNPALQQRAC